MKTEHFLNDYQTGFLTEIIRLDTDDNVIGRLLAIIHTLEQGDQETISDPGFEEDMAVCRAALQVWAVTTMANESE